MREIYYRRVSSDEVNWIEQVQPTRGEDDVSGTWSIRKSRQDTVL